MNAAINLDPSLREGWQSYDFFDFLGVLGGEFLRQWWLVVVPFCFALIRVTQ